MLNNLIKITNEIRKAKYPEAEVIFLAGSLVRGEGTSTSDLDLVVVFSELRSAYRDSYFFPIGAKNRDRQECQIHFFVKC